MKVYPTLVIRGTGLYELWKKGLYKNYPPERLVDLIARVLAIVPPWVRVYRIQRDIPMPLVTSGVEKGVLHQACSSKIFPGNSCDYILWSQGKVHCRELAGASACAHGEAGS